MVHFIQLDMLNVSFLRLTSLILVLMTLIVILFQWWHRIWLIMWVTNHHTLLLDTVLHNCCTHLRKYNFWRRNWELGKLWLSRLTDRNLAFFKSFSSILISLYIWNLILMQSRALIIHSLKIWFIRRILHHFIINTLESIWIQTKFRASTKWGLSKVLHLFHQRATRLVKYFSFFLLIEPLPFSARLLQRGESRSSRLWF